MFTSLKNSIIYHNGYTPIVWYLVIVLLVGVGYSEKCMHFVLHYYIHGDTLESRSVNLTYQGAKLPSVATHAVIAARTLIT